MTPSPPCSARATGGADILVTSGGASVGDYDLVQKAFTTEGMTLSFWRLALRPGRPLMHGRLGGMHVLGVPGNPVSAFVCGFLFLVPLIRRLTGRTDLERATESALLGVDLPENDERADYLRATLKDGPEGLDRHAVPDPGQLHDGAAGQGRLPRHPRALRSGGENRQPVPHR